MLWAGHGALPGNDGWVSLHLADQAPLTLPGARSLRTLSELHQAVLDALEPGGAWFFRQLADAVGATDDAALAAALWDLVWAGPGQQRHPRPAARADPRRHAGTHRSRRRRRRRGVLAAPAHPTTAGRWALLPALDTDPTRRAHATAERLLDRHGVVTRGAVAERAGAGRLRRRLQGAVGVRGLRPLPPRLLRRGPRRRPVRHRRAPSTGSARSPRSAPTPSRPRSRWPPPTPPTPTAPRCPGRPTSTERPPARPQGRRARRAGRRRCSPSTSSAAAAPCSPGPTTPTCSRPAADALATAVRRGRSAG